MWQKQLKKTTNYQGTNSLRRTTQKCQSPNWMKDFVSFKRGNQPKIDQAWCESLHPSSLNFHSFCSFLFLLWILNSLFLCQVILFLGTLSIENLIVYYIESLFHTFILYWWLFHWFIKIVHCYRHTITH